MYIGHYVNESKLLPYVRRMVRDRLETRQIGVRTCLLQQIRLEHFEIISSVSISTYDRSSRVARAKIYV